MGKMVIPETSELMLIINSVMNCDCKSVGLKKPASFKIKMAALSGKEYEKLDLLAEIASIVKSAGTTEESCYYYIIIVEVIRKVLSPKEETKKSSKKICKVENFIGELDKILKFI
jgi:hypothetical protein